MPVAESIPTLVIGWPAAVWVSQMQSCRPTEELSKTLRRPRSAGAIVGADHD
ncbi:hypothetical protein [Mycobacterium vicinigordonae]|uniref:Uncharacterized protein n=1 Tax=Mycobacterium vicinigordonae TaxID=1719132 RepID=A0A7D6DVK0_9MYCO|nr:hypothetical protein [Mycobacterium vicinigordonae]QLL05787.1 hypothetical protein H0P51_18465 [Mycobacterium vicinigordonae]